MEVLFNGWQLSGWWRRAGALTIDGCVLLAILIPLYTLLWGIIVVSPLQAEEYSQQTATLSTTTHSLLALLSTGLALLTSGIYFGLTMSRLGEHNGQSWGKQLLKICVIREEGLTVDFKYACFRQVLVIQLLFNTLLAGLTLGVAILINYLWPLVNHKHQAIHDKIVHSRVIRTDIARKGF